MMSSEFTVVSVDDWNSYGTELKNIIKKYMVWNSDKVRENVSIDVIKNEYKKYGIDFNIEKGGDIGGDIGYWESSFAKIKIIKVGTKVVQVVLIYKKENDNSLGREFYIKLIKKCKDMGFLIMKVVDGEVVFKDQINVGLIKKLNDVEGEKKIGIDNFIKKISISISAGVDGVDIYGDNFKGKWIKCISG